MPAWLHSGRTLIRRENLALRAELREFVKETINLMSRRIDEAKWGPLRVKAMAIYTPFVRLMKRLLLVTSVMETRLVLMEKLIRRDKDGKASAIFRAFHYSPAFRASLRAYTNELTGAH